MTTREHYQTAYTRFVTMREQNEKAKQYLNRSDEIHAYGPFIC